MGTPAGWYADPDVKGGQRYWDGHNWTEHRAEAQRDDKVVLWVLLLIAFAGIMAFMLFVAL